MEEYIQKLKGSVIEASKNPQLIHHEWFVTHHLDIVQKIALELCERYKEADANLVLSLVWLHDYPKILNKEKEHDIPFAKEVISSLLNTLQFESAFKEKILEYHEIFESKETFDLNYAPIEVKIVSSADAASHFFANFFLIYWKENASLNTNILAESNRKKMIKDWERKIVIPEVKEALKSKYEAFLDQSQISKDKFLDLK
jgi:hypothetical protein